MKQSLRPANLKPSYLRFSHKNIPSPTPNPQIERLAMNFTKLIRTDGVPSANRVGIKALIGSILFSTNRVAMASPDL